MIRHFLPLSCRRRVVLTPLSRLCLAPAAPLSLSPFGEGALFAVCTIKYFVVRQPPMTWTMKGLLVFMAAVTIWVLLALARVLFYSKHMIETTGNGAECSVLASSACYPSVIVVFGCWVCVCGGGVVWR